MEAFKNIFFFFFDSDNNNIWNGKTGVTCKGTFNVLPSFADKYILGNKPWYYAWATIDVSGITQCCQATKTTELCKLG